MSIYVLCSISKEGVQQHQKEQDKQGQHSEGGKKMNNIHMRSIFKTDNK